MVMDDDCEVSWKTPKNVVEDHKASRLVALCYNETCRGGTNREKDVGRDETWCPDCASALFWRRKYGGSVEG